jgi:hypothetical protein
VGKDVQSLQSVKPIRIAVSTVLDESRCRHKNSVWVWDVFMARVVFWNNVWLCA